MPDERTPGNPAAGLVRLANARPNREGLERDRHCEHGEGYGRRQHLLGMDDPADSLVQREDRADHEQDDRNDERVDVPFSAEPELMLLGLLPPGPGPSDQQ